MIVIKHDSFRKFFSALIKDRFPHFSISVFSDPKEFFFRDIKEVDLYICDQTYADCNQCAHPTKETRRYTVMVITDKVEKNPGIRCIAFYKGDMEIILNFIQGAEVFFLLRTSLV